MKCGVHRVWINPSYLDQVAQSVQKEDIREAIDSGWIKAKAIKGNFPCPCSEAPFKNRSKRDAVKVKERGLVLLTLVIHASKQVDGYYPCATPYSEGYA